MMRNATFNDISVIYRGDQCYWWRKPEKTTELPQVAKKTGVNHRPAASHRNFLYLDIIV